MTNYLPNRVKGEFIDTNLFKLTEDFIFTDPITDKVVVIKEGFKTNGSSVPRFLWWIENPFGEALRAAIPHDYYCRFKAVSRSHADKAFYTFLRDLNISYIKSKTMYIGVRIGAYT